MHYRRCGLVTLLAALAAPVGARADGHLDAEKPCISHLSWMTGSWAGNIGGPVLEENWTEAKAGSIAALVRITSAEGTSMVEIVNIQEMEDTLVLHIQQWDPGFVPRAAAQKMMLDSLGEQSVNFAAVSPVGLTTLGYSLTAEHQLLLPITTADDQAMTIPLAAMQRSPR